MTNDKPLSREVLEALYEVANQLGGYVDVSTPEPHAAFITAMGDKVARIADAILSLMEENERMREALEPFATQARRQRLDHPDSKFVPVTLGDCRKAESALSPALEKE